jgi:hypothetical protein
MAGPGALHGSLSGLDQVILLPKPSPNLPELRSYQSINCAGWVHWLRVITCWSGRYGLRIAAWDSRTIMLVDLATGRRGGWRIGDRPGLDRVLERILPFLVAVVGDGQDVP